MKTPELKMHRTGQAYIYWEGKCKYFGKYGSKQAEQSFRTWLAGLYGNKSPELESDLVADLFEAYTKEHTSKNLEPKLKAIADLGPLSGHRCHEYTPLVFRRHRARLVAAGTRCASYVNDLMRLVQRVFKWGVSMEMVGFEVYNQLKTVDPLKANEVKHQARKRKPAKRADVLRTIEELDPMPKAIVQLVLFTGARPGEICGMLASEVSKDGPLGTWVCRPDKHKTAHHGKSKYIVFGPKGQAILKEWWPKKGDWFFPSSLIVDHFQVPSVKQAVEAAAIRAGVPHWTPYQLRHLRMTELAVDKGLEIAASVAGHGETDTTRLYQHEPDIIALRDAV